MTYLDAVRRGRQSWWHYLAGTAVILFFWLIVGGFATLALALAFGLYGSGMEQSGPVSSGEMLKALASLGDVPAYLITNVSFPCFLLGILLAVGLVHQRTLRTLITWRKQVRWVRVFQGFGVWFILAAVVAGVDYVRDPADVTFSFDVARYVPFVFLALVLTPIQTTTEELFFRGYLVQWGSLVSRNKVFLAMLSGVLFALPHYTNPEVYSSFVLMMLFYFVLGAFLAWVSLKDGTLELAIGLHAANNLFTALIANYEGSALPTPAPFLTPGLDPAFNLLSAVAAMATFYVVFFTLPNRNRHPT
jgi:membrane protease YdiL (CAAX protease family)